MWGCDSNDWWQAPAGSRAPLAALLFDSVWVLQECNLDFRLKCIGGLNACRWAQFFCSFVVSYIPICISYKKLGSDWSTVKHCFLDIFHYIVLKNNFVGHTWYQNKEIHFKWAVEIANQFIVTCLIIQENLTSPCKSALFKVVGYWDKVSMAFGCGVSAGGSRGGAGTGTWRWAAPAAGPGGRCRSVLRWLSPGSALVHGRTSCLWLELLLHKQTGLVKHHVSLKHWC